MRHAVPTDNTSFLKGGGVDSSLEDSATGLGFLIDLLTHYPEADEDIVLPAILLHDVGWKMVPEKKQLEAFGPKRIDKKTQRLHEVEGVRIAEEILAPIDYEKEKIGEITAIIGGHDSREEALSLNDKLVKAADKLWRFTPTGVKIDHERFGIARDKYMAWLGTVIDEWLFTPKAKDMAREALSSITVRRRI